MKFFCTCGRGTEVFVALELFSVFKTCDPKINITDGKVFFEITNPQEKLKDILSLKSCERIFIEIVHSVDVKVFNNKQGTGVVRSVLSGVSEVQWTDSIETLENLRKMEHQISEDKKDADNNVDDAVNNNDRGDVDDDDGPNRKRFCNRVTTFRVSAKCSGRPSKVLNQKWLSCVVGQHLTSKYSLTVDLRHADMEVFFHLNDNGLVIGIPCCSRPLSKRSYVKHNGLRSTVASVLTSMCTAKPGMTLLDPMCGRGILLLEAASTYEGITVIGCDIDTSALEKADDNVSHFISTRQGFIQLMRCDARSMPLKSSSIDAIVCDIPFGNKHSLMKDMRSFLISINRLLVPGGKFIVLSGLKTTKQLLALVKESFTCDGPGNDSSDIVSGVSSGDRENLWKLLQRILECSGRSQELEEIKHVIGTSVDVTRHGDRLLGNEEGDDDDGTEVGCNGGGCDDDVEGKVNAGQGPPILRKELIHYLKLGETDSFLCIFRKMA